MRARFKILKMKEKKRKMMANKVMATMMVTMAQETPQAIGVMTMVVKQKNDPQHLLTTEQ